MHLKPILEGSLFKSLSKSPDEFYREFSQPKTKFGRPQTNDDGSYRMRDIANPNSLLKSRQREIATYLNKFELPDCMYGGVQGKSNAVNALQHVNNRYHLTIDLKNFFGNISNTRIHQHLIGRGLTWAEARVMTRIVTLHRRLPQGAPTSTILANLIFAPTAMLLENFCKEKGITFTVFVDDLTFSSSKNFKHHINQLLKIISAGGFFINHKKVHYRKYGCEITGLIVKKGILSLPKEMLKHIGNPGIKRYASGVIKHYNAHTRSS
jgi:RNA-directed DNA polymerase